MKDFLTLLGKTQPELRTLMEERVEQSRRVLQGLPYNRLNSGILDRFYVQVRRVDQMNLLAKHLHLQLDMDLKDEMTRVLEAISGLKYKTYFLKLWVESDVFDLLTSITLREMNLVGLLKEVSQYVVDHYPLASREQYLNFSLLARDKKRFLQVYRLMEQEDNEDLIEDYQLFHAILTRDEEVLRQRLESIVSSQHEQYEQIYKPRLEQLDKVTFDQILPFYLSGVAPYEKYVYPLLYEQEVR